MTQPPKKPNGELARLRRLEQVLSRIPSWVGVERTLDVLRRDFVIDAITDDIGDLLCMVSPPSRRRVIDKLAEVDGPNGISRFIEFLCSGKVRKRPFPASPVSSTDLLTPLNSPAALRNDSLATSIAFDSFWIESVLEGVAYFYAWHGHPLSTILVVFSDDTVTWIEVRGEGDEELDPKTSSPIVAYVLDRFFRAGFRLRRSGGRH